MEPFETIETKSRQRGLDFLVIGGLAVIFYGYSRDTADLDLLIPRGTRDAWLILLNEMGYTVHRDGNNFIQLDPPRKGAWPMDLMLVPEATFSLMLAECREVDMYDSRVRLPTLVHLIALKLHALKHPHPDRFMKDYLDVENLIRVNQIDLTRENIKQIFLKYGTVKLYGQFARTSKP